MKGSRRRRRWYLEAGRAEKADLGGAWLKGNLFRCCEKKLCVLWQRKAGKEEEKKCKGKILSTPTKHKQNGLAFTIRHTATLHQGSRSPPATRVHALYFFYVFLNGSHKQLLVFFSTRVKRKKQLGLATRQLSTTHRSCCCCCFIPVARMTKE